MSTTFVTELDLDCSVEVFYEYTTSLEYTSLNEADIDENLSPTWLYFDENTRTFTVDGSYVDTSSLY